jgi:hypothetical protein
MDESTFAGYYEDSYDYLRVSLHNPWRSDDEEEIKAYITEHRVYDEMFESACRNGKFDIIKYLVDVKAFKPNKIPNINNEEIVKFLIDKYQLPVKICWFCENGSLELVKYIVDKYGVISKDIKRKKQRMLRDACRGGNVDVVKYIFETFDLTYDDLKAYYKNIMGALSIEGHLEVFKYLSSKFDFDVRYDANKMFRLACKNGNLDFVMFLVSKYGLTREDAMSLDNDAANAKLPAVRKYLSEVFNVERLSPFYSERNYLDSLV